MRTPRAAPPQAKSVGVEDLRLAWWLTGGGGRAGGREGRRVISGLSSSCVFIDPPEGVKDESGRAECIFGQMLACFTRAS
mmetsp:Transcript_13746/g.30450  ORF Transcript_13746/g.30450 Transcript_13746/m.30450 type:complete len:80 (+) Transcript_13746:531-770(+)